MEKINDFNHFYRGTTSDFDEHEYLTDVSMLRHELEMSLLQCGAISGALDRPQPYQKIFDGEDYRIPKNGGIKIRCINGRPADIITPYGAFPVSRLQKGYYNTALDVQKQESLKNKLAKDYGLRCLLSYTIPTPTAENPNAENCFEIMEVRKLPWKEKEMPDAGESYLNHGEVPSGGVGFENYIQVISAEYGSVENYHKLLSSEQNYVVSALELVNFDFIEKGNEKYIIPETEFNDMVFHENEKFTDFVRKYPEKAQREKARLEINHPKRTQIVDNIDLGREM